MRISDWSSDVCSSDLHHQDRQTDRIADVQNRAHDLLAPRAIERRQRLVEQQEARARKQRPTDRHPPRFAPRKRARPAVEQMPDAEEPHRVVDIERRALVPPVKQVRPHRSEEHTSELQSLMRISYAVFCLKK